MKILVMGMGSRGDIEPLLSIAQILIKNGMSVICSVPQQFKAMADEAGVPFYGLSEKFLDILNGDDVKTISYCKDKSALRKARSNLKLKHKEMIEEVIRQQHDLIHSEKPDRVIYNWKTTYPFIWGIKNPGKTLLISVMPAFLHEIKGIGHIGINKSFGSFINKLGYFLNVIYFSRLIRKDNNRYDAGNYSTKQLAQYLLHERLVYTISPSILSKPDHWPLNANIVGFYERQKFNNWKPDNRVLTLLKNHKKVLLFTFGSMLNDDPEGITNIFIEIFVKYKMPVIVCTCWGGLVDSGDKPENVVFIKEIPFDWVMPKLYGIIHHGGSGTTQTALKYGCVNLLIPHLADQFAWNRIVFRSGAGPFGLPINKVKSKKAKLETLIVDFYKNSNYKKIAERISRNMQNEDFQGQLLDIIKA